MKRTFSEEMTCDDIRYISIEFYKKCISAARKFQKCFIFLISRKFICKKQIAMYSAFPMFPALLASMHISGPFRLPELKICGNCAVLPQRRTYTVKK